jgi:hypothetical protein
MKSTEYKMRAECAADLGRFLAQVTVNTFAAERFENFPDMEASFTSPLTLEQIRMLIAQIEDGHVMLETVSLAKDYTGERNSF